MSEIKALEKLREFKPPTGSWEYSGAPIINGIADEIEAEIAERFMELPIDADGVPIHVGETVYGKYIRGNPEYIVSGFDFDTKHDQWNIKIGAASSASQGLLSHVKPRTLEDVMTEYEELAANQNVKDYFEISKELRTIQSKQFRDKPELELYKDVNGYRFYIELPYDELWIMTDKVEVKHHSYSYRYERPDGSTVISCSSLCGHPREWAIERLNEAIEEIRELLGVDE